MTNVFIIGSHGYTKNYGGWETFVHGLIDNRIDGSIHYYVFEISNDKNEDKKETLINGVTCITLYIKQTGSISMVLFDYYATKFGIDYVKSHKIENPIFFYLGLRIGPYIWFKKKKIKKMGIRIFENPAGIEWKRTKWNRLVQLYTFIAAKMMASSVDYLICDNGGVLDEYHKFRCCRKIKKTVIAYGTYPRKDLDVNVPSEIASFYDEYGIKPKDYYLILGRLVPENNYELMLSEIKKYKGQKKFLIICNIKKENKFYKKLKNKFKLENDHRVIFAGELYDQNKLAYVRQNAFAYIHGHSVGGTNPGLLEALSNTDLCILFDCVFNKEVGKNNVLYFSREEHLSEVLLFSETISNNEIKKFGEKSRENMKNNYSWDLICRQYEKVFKGESN